MRGLPSDGLRPLTRVLMLLIVAPAISSFPLADLLALALALVAAYAATDRTALRRLRFGVLRLRWLLLSIIVLYLGFTPGDALSPWTPGLSWEGLWEGCRRILVLVSLLAAVYWLLSATPVPQLVAALDQLLTPLSRLGLPTGRATALVALTLSAVDGVEGRYRTLKAQGLKGLDLAAAWIGDIEHQPPTATHAVLHLPWPRVWEWLLLVLMLLMVWNWPR